MEYLVRVPHINATPSINFPKTFPTAEKNHPGLIHNHGLMHVSNGMEILMDVWRKRVQNP